MSDLEAAIRGVAKKRASVITRKCRADGYPDELIQRAIVAAISDIDSAPACIDAIELVLAQWEDDEEAWFQVICGVDAPDEAWDTSVDYVLQTHRMLREQMRKAKRRSEKAEILRRFEILHSPVQENAL